MDQLLNQHSERCDSVYPRPISYLLVQVRVKRDLLHVLGLAQLNECFPGSVVGVENLTDMEWNEKAEWSTSLYCP